MALHEKCSVCNKSMSSSSILYCECCGIQICEFCLELEPSYDYSFPKEDCPFCTGKLVDDSQFLQYLLEHHIDTDKDELIDEYKIFKVMSPTVDYVMPFMIE